MFHVFCCGVRRGLLNGVLVCPRCDYRHDHATGMPNGNQTKDMPSDVKMFTPERIGQGDA